MEIYLVLVDCQNISNTLQMICKIKYYPTHVFMLSHVEVLCIYGLWSTKLTFVHGISQERIPKVSFCFLLQGSSQESIFSKNQTHISCSRRFFTAEPPTVISGSRSVVSDFLQSHGLYPTGSSVMEFPGNAEVGFCFFSRDLPPQGSNRSPELQADTCIWATKEADRSFPE